MRSRKAINAHFYVEPFGFNVCGQGFAPTPQYQKQSNPTPTLPSFAVAIFHFTVKQVKRSEGRSSVATAAYRSGMTLVDDRTGETHDYSRKQGVEGVEIMAPENSPAWAFEPSRLWNEVERFEVRKDAQVARDIEFSLPRELPHDEMKNLAKAMVQSEFVSKGMVALVCFHDLDSDNPHCHVQLTMREIGPDGFGQKNRDWNKKELVAVWREAWADLANDALKRSGLEDRIDHRTLHAQRIEAIQQGDLVKAIKLARDPQIHLGSRPGPDRQAYNDEVISVATDLVDQAAVTQRRLDGAAEQKRVASAAADAAAAKAQQFQKDLEKRQMKAAEAKTLADDLRKQAATAWNEWLLAERAAKDANRLVRKWKEAHPRRAKLFDSSVLKFFRIRLKVLQQLRGERDAAWHEKERFRKTLDDVEQRKLEAERKAAALALSKPIDLVLDLKPKHTLKQGPDPRPLNRARGPR